MHSEFLTTQKQTFRGSPHFAKLCPSRPARLAVWSSVGTHNSNNVKGLLLLAFPSSATPFLRGIPLLQRFACLCSAPQRGRVLNHWKLCKFGLPPLKSSVYYIYILHIHTYVWSQISSVSLLTYGVNMTRDVRGPSMTMTDQFFSTLVRGVGCMAAPWQSRQAGLEAICTP